ncbi:hypothetical protein pipiens_012349 [Culex pipiens pipiens]|uniref:Uncharacterized protein n=1 Tax=Culex pipiens pipiens TaxID=38569 RepID=A0ABD1D2S2_CULPP
MKSIILLLIASLAVATSGSYLPTAWPYAAAGWNSGAWNTVGVLPYANSWSYPSVYNNGWNNGWNGGLVTKVNPWGLSYGAGWGYHGLAARSVVPVEKQIAATPGSLDISPVPVGGERFVGY